MNIYQILLLMSSFTGLVNLSQGGSSTHVRPCCICVKSFHCKRKVISKAGLDAIVSDLPTSLFSLYNKVNVKRCPSIGDTCCHISGLKGTCHKRELQDGTIPEIKSRTDLPTSMSFSASQHLSLSGRSASQNFGKSLKNFDSPWHAVILERLMIGTKEMLHFVSTASLIHPFILLTSAKSIRSKNVGNLLARVGERSPAIANQTQQRQEVKIKEIVSHPRFSPSSFVHDVAIVFLQNEITREPNIREIPLAEAEQDFNPDRCIAAMWYKNSKSPYLLTYEATILPRQDCQKSLRTTKLSHYFQLSRSFVCSVGGNSSNNCQFDKGSPLVCESSEDPTKLLQVGIGSWRLECKKDDIPTVFSDIVQHFDWIKGEISKRGHKFSLPPETRFEPENPTNGVGKEHNSSLADALKLEIESLMAKILKSSQDITTYTQELKKKQKQLDKSYA